MRVEEKVELNVYPKKEGIMTQACRSKCQRKTMKTKKMKATSSVGA